MIINLPTQATPVSQERAQLMYTFVQSCPPALGREIFLYCSVAKGYADGFSDIEVTFLVDEIQAPAVYEAWLAKAGAKVDEATIPWGGGYTTKSWLDGVFIEAAWRSFDAVAEMVQQVRAGATVDHWVLVDAWHILWAVPLTEAPRLASWQEALAVYPDGLQAKLIADACRHLTEPHWYPLSLMNVIPLAVRQVPMALSGELAWTVERSLRILFAVNEVLEPDYKWLMYEAERLTIKPSRLVERVNEVFMLPDLLARVRCCYTLLLDVLGLVPDAYDVSAEIAQVTAVLQSATMPKN